MIRRGGLLVAVLLAGMAHAQAVEVPAATLTVRPGDTLSAIATRNGALAEAIARANRLVPPDRVRAGQRLRIPAGRYHRVRRGESGIAIGRRYGVDWGRVATLNRLAEPFILYEGQRLLLPSAREVATMSLEERAAAFRIDIDDLVTGAEPARSASAAPSPLAPLSDAAGRFAWPLDGRVLRRFGREAGGRRSDGIELATDPGAAIRAAADGVVAYAGRLAGFGRVVLLRHPGGWHTVYARAEALLVARGQSVKRGQRLAKAAAGEVHFQIRRGRAAVDPLRWLPSRA